LINFARPFIYTTALPPHSIASIDCAFEFLKDNIILQKILREKINIFKSELNTNTSLSESAIQPIVISGNVKIKNITDHIQTKGFDVRPILSPTVKEGTERIRVCLHTFNKDEDIVQLVSLLNALTDPA
jgi:8-amino-7-oxononanoate synthase